MTVADQIIFISGIFLVISILAGLLSSRVGAPLLLVFLGLGMLAGEDGFGGIHFSDFDFAYLIGSLALAIILFDGGFRTPFESLRRAWAPAASLATLGVLVTAAITGLAAAWFLGLPLIAGLLMGAIVGSTDAAAVFLLLHQRGMDLRKRLGATLEVESGVNDPMAIFLTVMLVELLAAGEGAFTWEILQVFAFQLGFGAIAGGLGGLILAYLINRLELAAGLYPVFAIAAALVVFGGAQLIEGSGFLAVYLAGIIAGNQRLRANQLIRRFNDGFAWLSQIVMFLMLGLLVTPSQLLDDALPAVGVALVLIFLARPIAVAICLAPFRFSLEERIFVAWVGLRGAVPIFLAIIPVLGGLENAMLYFNVAFTAVLLSLLLQGWTIPWVARRLDLELPPAPEPTGRTELDLLREFERDLIAYRITERSPAVHKPINDLALPRRVRIVSILRRGAILPQEAWKTLEPGDYLLTLIPPEHVITADRLFVPRTDTRRGTKEALLGDFSFPATTPLGALADLYNITVPQGQRSVAVGDFLADRMKDKPSVGDRLKLGSVDLIVRDVQGTTIREVGLVLEPHLTHLMPRMLIGPAARLRQRASQLMRRARRWIRGKPMAQARLPAAGPGNRPSRDNGATRPSIDPSYDYATANSPDTAEGPEAAVSSPIDRETPPPTRTSDRQGMLNRITGGWWHRRRRRGTGA